MNRKKKINQIYKQKQKKMNSRLHRSNKPRYVSKAERELLATQEAEQQENGEIVELIEADEAQESSQVNADQAN